MIKTFLAVLVTAFLLAGCSQGNVSEDDSLKQYFDTEGVNGSFGMFDNGQGHFTIYNLHRYRDSSYLPAGTFDILQSLIAVQTGVVKDDSAVVFKSPLDTTDIRCGGIVTLNKAFRNSCTRAFEELAGRIGKDTLKKWVDSLGYGNKDISSDAFWMDNHLTITSDEQLGLVKKLYFDQLPFFPRSQKVVRQMMLMDGNSNYQLSYKTGTGVRKDGHAFTWYIGWIEENKDPYFFVLNLDAAGAGTELEPKGLRILKNILKQQGFFQGKK
ncbi:MAG TPA: penicillin-binding transpeptidase domain-containing protein [Puia sp.]|nr:penicillin-binding transpeptidase domain-containing protein [Puia sp.]